MTWHVYLVRTMTGEVGRRLTVDTAAEGSWSISLNGIEECGLTVAARAFRELERDWWSPWKASVLITYTRTAGGGEDVEVPMLLGPIVQRPVQEGEKVRITMRGLGALLDRRVVTARDYAHEGDTPPASEMVYLAKSTASLTGRSLGTIAQDVVRLSTSDKAAGDVPIRYASPRETGSSLNERNYEGFNLSNNGTWKRLVELTEVINGPDIAFRPEWADAEHSHVRWAMVHGTRAQPAIAQTYTMDLDTTSPRSAASGLEVSVDAAEMTNRVWWTGAGEGAGTLIRAAQDLDALGPYMPLLEAVGSTSDSDNPDLIQEHARSRLAAGLADLIQYSVTVSLADRRTAPGLWHVGDEAVLTIAGRIDVPDGTRRVRVIAAKGTLGSDAVTLELQED